MVDVGDKTITSRRAVAEGRIAVGQAAMAALVDNAAQKGDVLGAARLAGIMAAKKTSDLIPLCHPLPLSKVKVEFEVRAEAGLVLCRAEAKTEAKTGVEMEALTAVSVALLTIYDMLKAVDKSMTVGPIRLVFKSGGKSGEYRAPESD